MDFSIHSTIGIIRRVNEDYGSFHKKLGGEFIGIICDGMGGHAGGDIASKIATDFLIEEYKIASSFRKKSPEEIKEWFDFALHEVKKHFEISAKEDPNLHDMGTTIVAVIGVGDVVYTANIGDSRAYVMQKSKLTQITEDHNIANKLIKNKQITKKEALHHPSKNMLYNVFSLNQEINFDWYTINLIPGCFLVLMSDGVYSEVSNHDIAKIIKKSKSVDEATVEICNKANANGGRDNNIVLIGEF